MTKTLVGAFNLQPTLSYPDGAPQREMYDNDATFFRACRSYAMEWADRYQHKGRCKNSECPQCSPFA